jgi:hypothetical protein
MRRKNLYTLEELNIKIINEVHEWLDDEESKFLVSKIKILPLNRIEKKSHKYTIDDPFKVTFIIEELLNFKHTKKYRFKFNIQNYLNENGSLVFQPIIDEVIEKLKNFNYWFEKFKNEEREDDYYEEDDEHPISLSSHLYGLGLEMDDDCHFIPLEIEDCYDDGTHDEDYGIENYKLKKLKRVYLNKQTGKHIEVSKWVPDYYQSDCYFIKYQIKYKIIDENDNIMDEIFGL